MFRPSSSFEKLLDKATTNLKLEPDWPVILQICDMIRQGDVQPKIALQAIRKKMTNPNPHIVMFALNVLESCVKNCGAPVHDEIGTKTYMEGLKELIKTTPHENVKNKLLELIQAWAHAFRNSPKYRAVQDTVNILKSEGYKFPTLKESDAMFSADTAPEWADGEVCHRCRVQFSVLQRKHHCRACGQVFCAQCTSKMSTLPKFGIEKEVRVCDSCYDKVNKPSSAAATKTDELPIEYLTSSLAQQSQAPPPRKTEAELKEEEDLQLAIALSQSEAEGKSHQRSKSAPISSTVSQSYSPPPKFSLSTSPDQENPELARYLNRNYWQQQSDFSNASAPAQQQASKQQTQPALYQPTQNGVEDEEMEDFITSLSSNVEMFVNRMKSNSSRGRSISNDSSVQTLFLNITAMHSKLLRYIQQQDDKRVYYEGLQDKLTQMKDARAALDALREEHREKMRREAELAEKQRQMQMAQKLDIMRKKKQEYLAYQRQLALQRIQDQEREMQLRQEQQKQQYMMGSYGSMPYMPQGGFGNDGMVPGRFPGSPQQHNFPAYNPSSVPVEQLMAQAHMMNMPGGPMVVGTEQGMMVSGGPRPMMGGPNMGIPMAPPQGPHHPQGPPQGPHHHPQGPPQGGHPMGPNPGMQPHMGPGLQPPTQPGPPSMGPMNQQGRPIAPPMGPSPQHSAPHMGPQPGAPPMGPQPGAPPMGPPSLQGPPNNMGMPPQQMGPPSHMMPPQGFPSQQQEPLKREEEERTAELISFD